MVKNATFVSIIHSYQKSRWQPPPSWISKLCCYLSTIYLILHQSSLNLVGMLRIRFITQLLSQNWIITKIQDGGGRHFGFRKTVAISLQLDQFLPNLMGMLPVLHGMPLSCQSYKFTAIQDGGCSHPNLRKAVAISLLLNQFSPNLNGMLREWYRMHYVLLTRLLRFMSDSQQSHQIWRGLVQ